MVERARVVLVHGAGMATEVWAPLIAALPGGLAEAIDLPGHGARPGAPLATIAAMADWLGAALEGRGGGPVVVAGHSMGALVALELAARHPRLVRGLALLGAGPAMPVHPDLLALARADAAAAAQLMAKWAIAEGAPPELAVAMRGQIAAAAPGVLASDLEACDGYAGAAAAAERIACPTVVVLGALDKMTRPAAGEALAAAIAGGRAVVLDGVGHMMMAERPQAVAALLAAL